MTNTHRPAFTVLFAVPPLDPAQSCVAPMRSIGTCAGRSSSSSTLLISFLKHTKELYHLAGPCSIARSSVDAMTRFDDLMGVCCHNGGKELHVPEHAMSG